MGSGRDRGRARWDRGPPEPRRRGAIGRGRRGAPVTDAAVRASAGALLHLRQARVANIARAIERLQDVGFTAIGLDGSAERTIFDTRCPEGRVAIVLGSEGTGLSRLVRERCD